MIRIPILHNIFVNYLLTAHFKELLRCFIAYELFFASDDHKERYSDSLCYILVEMAH
jgi:hypothetical protein